MSMELATTEVYQLIASENCTEEFALQCEEVLYIRILLCSKSQDCRNCKCACQWQTKHVSWKAESD